MSERQIASVSNGKAPQRETRIEEAAMHIPVDAPAEAIRRLALRPNEAAVALGIAPRTLWKKTASGEIPHVKVGARVLYPIRALELWLEKQMVKDSR